MNQGRGAGEFWHPFSAMYNTIAGNFQSEQPQEPPQPSSSSASSSDHRGAGPAYLAAPTSAPVGSHDVMTCSPTVTIGAGEGKTIVTTENWFEMKNKGFSELRFYRECDPYFELANTYPCNIKVDKKWYISTENYFQCQGFGGPEHEEHGKKFVGRNPEVGPTPMDAVRYARNHPGVKESIWKGEWNRGLSNKAMREALQAKFNIENHPGLAMLLMETWQQGKVLVEDSPTDCFWGCATNPRTKKPGENKLGLMLMDLREQLESAKRELLDNDQQDELREQYEEEFPQYAMPSEPKGKGKQKKGGPIRSKDTRTRRTDKPYSRHT